MKSKSSNYMKKKTNKDITITNAIPDVEFVEFQTV